MLINNDKVIRVKMEEESFGDRKKRDKLSQNHVMQFRTTSCNSSHKISVWIS